MKVRDHKGLIVWQSSMELVVLVYKLTARLPKDERFALGDQLHRASVSIPANIAEGNARVHRGEYVIISPLRVGRSPNSIPCSESRSRWATSRRRSLSLSPTGLTIFVACSTAS